MGTERGPPMYDFLRGEQTASGEGRAGGQEMDVICHCPHGKIMLQKAGTDLL